MTPDTRTIPPWRGRTVVGAILAFLVVLAFWPVLGHDFVTFDDEKYVTANPHVRSGLTLAGLRWAWTTFHAANWHPLTWMSHQLDWQLFGPDATGHHLTSLVLHVANTLLLFLILERLTSSTLRSALVAVLFGVHPLHVESVAWVAERKDVLSALFWLLAIGAWVRYVRAPGLLRYAAVWISMLLGLCAKPMLVTLPFTLLLLDVWPLGRRDPSSPRCRSPGFLILEKVPLLVLAAASSVVTVLAQRAGGAVATLESHPLDVRLANAVVAYATYLWKTIWPTGLAVPYPHPGPDLPLWKVAGSLSILAAVTWGAVASRRSHPYLLFGWLWFLGTLVPVIGLVQVGPQAMADRYTYVPLVGIFVMAAWGVPSAVGPLSVRERSATSTEPDPVRRQTALLAVALLLVPALTAATWAQLAHWRDESTLARRALAVTANNAVAHDQLGLALVRGGDATSAIPHFLEALEISPRFAEAHNNLAGALVDVGRIDEALEHYRKALQLRPDYPEAWLNSGVALVRQGRIAEAITRFDRAARLRPGYGKAHGNLAAAHFSLGHVDRARLELERARDSGFEPPADLVRAIESAGAPR